MLLNINQKIVLLMQFIELSKSAYGPEYLPPGIGPRARKVMNWLRANLPSTDPESLAQLEGMPELGPGETLGAINISKIEFIEGLLQSMEAIIAAELSPDRIPDREPTVISRGRPHSIRRHGRKAND